MSDKITESTIEKFAIELLEKTGYQYIYGPNIAPDSGTPERESFEDVILLERLQEAVGRINPSVPSDSREDAIKQVIVKRTLRQFGYPPDIHRNSVEAG